MRQQRRSPNRHWRSKMRYDSVPWRNAVSPKWGTLLDIEEIRTFVEVADAGGISSAALRLGVSKSIVSRRLFRLEAELGVQLLARTTRGAALTEAGVTFRDYACQGPRRDRRSEETILPAGDLARPLARRRAAFFRPDPLRSHPCGNGPPPSPSPDPHLLQ